MVNDEGFKHMLSVFEPHYTSPDRKTISSNHIPSLYDTIKADITRQITDDAHYFSIATDLWTS